jgi:putative peptide zinc metalloprotease protein
MRCTVYDPRSDMSYSFGLREVGLARRFNGQRSLHDIAQCVLDEEGRVIPMEKLQAFRARLLDLNLLEDETTPSTRRKRARRDPASGITYGPLKDRLMISLIRFDPSNVLELLYLRARFLCTPWFVVTLSVIVFGSAGLLLFELPTLFLHDVVSVYQGGVQVFALHYVVLIVSSLLHEFGHALACRHYRVRTTELGVAIYLLLATGWARPVQREWSALERWQRIVTILMGPFVSLAFAASGVLLWHIMPAHSVLASVAVVMAISSSVAIVPTLLPIFNGDAYLALTEWLGIPCFRHEAFRYVGGILSSKPQVVSAPKKRLYWTMFAATCLGWAAAWSVIYYCITKFF